jgi:tetratricopeptide (TPR) repeat protein
LPKTGRNKNLIQASFVTVTASTLLWQQSSCAKPAAPARTEHPGHPGLKAQQSSAQTAGRPFHYTTAQTNLKPAEVSEAKALVEELNDVLRKNPNDVPALNRRARCYLALQDVHDAAQDCSKALSIEPDQPESASIAYALIDVYNRDMDEENARHFFDLAIKAYPNEARLYKERGELLHGMGKSKEGLADETKALTLDPNYSKAYFARGEIETALGDMRSAVVDFGKSAPYKELRYVSNLRQAQCYELLKNWKEAAASYGRILVLHDTDLTDRLKAQVHRANDYEKMGETESALKDLSTVIAAPREPTMKIERNNETSIQALAYQARASILVAQKKYDLAIKDYTRVIGLEEEWGEHTPKWYLERSKLYRKIGKTDLALKDEELAAKMSPPKK